MKIYQCRRDIKAIISLLLLDREYGFLQLKKICTVCSILEAHTKLKSQGKNKNGQNLDKKSRATSKKKRKVKNKTEFADCEEKSAAAKSRKNESEGPELCPLLLNLYGKSTDLSPYVYDSDDDVDWVIDDAKDAKKPEMEMQCVEPGPLQYKRTELKRIKNILNGSNRSTAPKLDKEKAEKLYFPRALEFGESYPKEEEELPNTANLMTKKSYKDCSFTDMEACAVTPVTSIGQWTWAAFHIFEKAIEWVEVDMENFCNIPKG